MSALQKAAAFGAALVLLFGAAFGVGKLFDDEPAAYAVTASYQPGQLALTIAEGDSPVTDYQVRHEKLLHVIAVRKDFGDYRHLHPERTSGGGWTVSSIDLTPGEWRLYADFQPKGAEPVVAHDDLTVPGDPEPAPAAPVNREVVVDGYRVQLTGDLVSDGEARLALRVTRDGRWVAADPYLGAKGHLVVIRDRDLSYLHAHPLTEEQLAPEPPVIFEVQADGAGRHHLYFDFKVGPTVHTAQFVLDAQGSGATTHDDGGMDHGDH